MARTRRRRRGRGDGGAGATGNGGATTTGDAGPCTSAAYGGHDYVFCPTPLEFADARIDCGWIALVRSFIRTSAKVIERCRPLPRAGMLPLTGTASEDHMREDLEVQRFELDIQDTSAIEHPVT